MTKRTSQYGNPAPDQQRVADEAADHDELALREVHHVGRLEDEDEPERDQRVHAAGRESVLTRTRLVRISVIAYFRPIFLAAPSTRSSSPTCRPSRRRDGPRGSCRGDCRRRSRT